MMGRGSEDGRGEERRGGKVRMVHDDISIADYEALLDITIIRTACGA